MRPTVATLAWQTGEISAASAGYSCLVQGGVSSTRGGILFEAVGTTIAYAEFPLVW